MDGHMYLPPTYYVPANQMNAYHNTVLHTHTHKYMPGCCLTCIGRYISRLYERLHMRYP